nr:PREDICTED: ribonuclease UK114-like [Bemisia tabaci]
MSTRRIIYTEAAPKPIGPYSQAVLIDKTLYISGITGNCPASGKLVSGGVVEQARQLFKNMAAILKEAGGDFSNVLKTTVFLKDLNDFATVNQIYAEHFKEPHPARSCFQVVKNPLDALVEIEAIARIE